MSKLDEVRFAIDRVTISLQCLSQARTDWGQGYAQALVDRSLWQLVEVIDHIREPYNKSCPYNVFYKSYFEEDAESSDRIEAFLELKDSNKRRDN